VLRDRCIVNHLRSTMAAVGSVAGRLMAKMGWAEGKGLGKSETGIVAPIKASKRVEALGVGAEFEKGPPAHAILTGAMQDFNTLLGSLSSFSTAPPEEGTKSSGKRKRRGSEASAASEGSDGVEKIRRKRKEGGGSGGAPAAEAVSYIGRVGHAKVLRGKNASGYSAADLAAIFGKVPALPDFVIDRKPAADASLRVESAAERKERRRARREARAAAVAEEEGEGEE
jgi:hypothetical protein